MDGNDAEKAFGNNLNNLRDAIKKELGDLRKADVVKLEGNDVQVLSDAAALGVLRQDGRNWELKTRDCKATELDASEL
jgi:hypothetical protein